MSISDVLELPSRLTLISSSDFGSTTLASETKLQSSYVIYSYLWERCFEPFKFLRFYLIFFLSTLISTAESSQKKLFDKRCVITRKSLFVCRAKQSDLFCGHFMPYDRFRPHFISHHDIRAISNCLQNVPI